MKKKKLTPERRKELIKKFREINGMADPEDPLASLRPGPRAYLVPDGKSETDDDSAIIQIMYLDYFLPAAEGDAMRASMNHAAWISGKMKIKDDTLSQVVQKLVERRSRYQGRQRDDENAGYFEIVRSFIETSPGKKTFSRFRNYWKTLPFPVRNNKTAPPFSDDTFIRWRTEILKS